MMRWGGALGARRLYENGLKEIAGLCQGPRRASVGCVFDVYSQC